MSDRKIDVQVYSPDGSLQFSVQERSSVVKSWKLDKKGEGDWQICIDNRRSFIAKKKVEVTVLAVHIPLREKDSSSDISQSEYIPATKHSSSSEEDYDDESKIYTSVDDGDINKDYEYDDHIDVNTDIISDIDDQHTVDLLKGDERANAAVNTTHDEIKSKLEEFERRIKKIHNRNQVTLSIYKMRSSKAASDHNNLVSTSARLNFWNWSHLAFLVWCGHLQICIVKSYFGDKTDNLIVRLLANLWKHSLSV